MGREIMPKEIKRIGVPNAVPLYYTRCTDLFRNPHTRDYVTAHFYVRNKEQFEIIIE